MYIGADRDQLTICAVSTPPGYGGISVIRVSGPKSKDVVQKVFKNHPKSWESHRAYYGIIVDPESKTDLDQALILYMGEGKSYTGEHTFEISCHGNPIVCDQILKALVHSGATTAIPGEFTYRAFMNNRLDLVQAESVLSLIESRSQKAAELSLRQLEGALSKRIDSIEKDLTWCLAHIEASIDFSTEGLDVSSTEELSEKIGNCANEVEKLLQTYRQGKIIKDGVRVALLGQPNVGKSSLLNLLIGYDRAIVDSTPGTTRDIVDADVVYKGLRFVFQDTAGLRDQTHDHIEAQGIKRSQTAAAEADLVLFVVDTERGWGESEDKWFKTLSQQPVLFLANKTDKLKDSQTRETIVKNVQSATNSKNSPVLFVSALDKMHGELILGEIHKMLTLGEKAENDIALSQARHYENLLKAHKFMTQSLSSLKGGVGAEFVSLDLKEALMALQETLGKYFDDQIMDRVFKEFCIGK